MLAKILTAIFRPIFFLLFPYRVIGRENIPAQGSGVKTVLCSNHTSMYDPILLHIAQKRRIFFMAKEELFRNPITRWVLGGIFGGFPVARGAGDTTALDKAVSLAQSGELMGIFPEGTRSKDGSLGRFHSGAALIAARAGANVLPVAISGKPRLFRRMTVSFGKLMTPEDLHLTDPDKPELRHATRLMMARIGEMLAEIRPQTPSVDEESAA
jgi:1-acyl-sn-glycerol-3-phosphate acyltransferase